MGSLCLKLLAEMIPELGLGDHLVASEEADGVHFRVGVLFGG